jgi:hypothetical protein
MGYILDKVRENYDGCSGADCTKCSPLRKALLASLDTSEENSYNKYIAHYGYNNWEPL